MKYIYFFIFTAMIFSGCSQKVPSYETVSVPQEKREKIEAAEFASDLFTLTEIIDLDLDYELWPFSDIVLGEEYIIGIVGSSVMRAYAWHREGGRFLGELSPYGKGPGEALSAYSAVFIDNSTALVFDMVLMRATVYRLTPDGFSVDDVIDITGFASSSTVYAWEKDGRVYLFGQSGGIDTCRINILDHSLIPIKSCFPREHLSYAMFELYVISNDRIFMTDELYHKSIKDLKRNPWQVKGGGEIFVSDLDGKLLGRITLPFDQLLMDIIPDSRNETFYVKQQGKEAYIIDTDGKVLNVFSLQWDIEQYPWLKTSLPTNVPRGKWIFVDRGVEGKLTLRIFEYDV